MGCDVDVLGIRKESKRGDANALHWVNLNEIRNEQKSCAQSYNLKAVRLRGEYKSGVSGW